MYKMNRRWIRLDKQYECNLHLLGKDALLLLYTIHEDAAGELVFHA